MRNSAYGCVFLGALAAMTAPAATAQPPYPVKSIRLIVPFAAGGSSDYTARTLAHRIGADWGQQVVVDNRAGGTGVIGVQLAAKAAPDGYTILFASSSTFATAPAGTPRAIVAKFNQKLVAALASPETRESLLKQGLEPVGGTPVEFAAHIKSELARWTQVFKEMGLQGDQLR